MDMKRFSVDRGVFGGRVVLAAGLMVLVLLFSACGLGQNNAAQGDSPTPTPPDVPLEEQAMMEWPDTTMNDIMTDPDAYQGEEVKLQGYITDLVGEQAFLFGEASVASENDMLVFLGNDEQVVTEDTTQHLIGTVRMFDEAVAGELGVSVEDAAFADVVGQPVLVAKLVWPVEGTDVADISVTDIVQDPAAFHGTDVHLSATVREVFGESIFRVSHTEASDDEEILVVVANGSSQNEVREQSQVQIAGTVYTFVEADIQAYAGVDIPSSLLVEYENEPVIVATSVSTGTL